MAKHKAIFIKARTPRLPEQIFLFSIGILLLMPGLSFLLRNVPTANLLFFLIPALGYLLWLHCSTSFYVQLENHYLKYKYPWGVIQVNLKDIAEFRHEEPGSTNEYVDRFRSLDRLVVIPKPEARFQEFHINLTAFHYRDVDRLIHALETVIS